MIETYCDRTGKLAPMGGGVVGGEASLVSTQKLLGRYTHCIFANTVSLSNFNRIGGTHVVKRNDFGIREKVLGRRGEERRRKTTKTKKVMGITCFQ